LQDRLTDAAIRKARPRDKPYKLTDGRGLYVIVNKNGSRWWRFNFTLAGKRRTMSLGVYPDVELGDARTERDRIRKQVAAGVDPIAARRAPPEADATFEAVALQWMEANRAEWNDRTYRIRKARLERHVFPEIGSQDVRSIEPTEMLRVIRKIEQTGVSELPWRMRADCGAIFQFAIASGLQARDPTSDIRNAIRKQAPVAHRAFIRPADMGAFLVKLIDGEADEFTIDALTLTILTVSRTVEVRFAAAAEFEGLDGERPQWRIPAARMKMKREHIVPLSRQAVAIVERRLAAADGGLLFRRRTRSGAMSENTMLYAMYRAGFHSRATVHGFRRTFSTLANEAVTRNDAGEEVPLWHSDWIERQLAHVPDNKVRAVYNAAEYLSQRRRLLQWWADWLDQERETASLIG
jgi:integrase